MNRWGPVGVAMVGPLGYWSNDRKPLRSLPLNLMGYQSVGGLDKSHTAGTVYSRDSDKI